MAKIIAVINVQTELIVLFIEVLHQWLSWKLWFVQRRRPIYCGIHPGDSVGRQRQKGRPRGNIGRDKKPRCEATEGNNNRTSEYFWRSSLPVSHVEPPGGEQWEAGEVEKKSAVAGGESWALSFKVKQKGRSKPRVTTAWDERVRAANKDKSPPSLFGCCCCCCYSRER